MLDFFYFTKNFLFTDLIEFISTTDSRIYHTGKKSVSDAPKLILNLLAYTDYFLIIAVVLLALILGLYKYENKYKNNIYLLCIVARIGYIRIKEIAKSYYENSDEKFLITTITDWSMKIRTAKPLKGGEEKPSYVMYDKIKGYEIMYPIDISGHMIMLMSDATFQNDDYFLILGCFTSTNTKIDGLKKDQYYLPYPEPKVILKTQAKLDVYEADHIALRTLAHKQFSDSLTPPPRDLY